MTKKFSLREFQESVAARLKNAAGTAPGAAKLGFLVGTQRWLVELADVSEALPVPALAAVPLTRAWFLGVASLRGNLYGAVDLSAFLGGDPTELNAEARLLLAHARFQVNSGLVVSRMLGLRGLEQFQERRPESALPWVATEYVDAEGNIWKMLDMHALLAHPDFLQAGV